jgi:hypothetical protein
LAVRRVTEGLPTILPEPRDEPVNEHIALKSPFENQSYRKSDSLALDAEVSRLKAADPFRFGMSRQCDVLAITTSTAPIEPEFPELITS